MRLHGSRLEWGAVATMLVLCICCEIRLQRSERLIMENFRVGRSARPPRDHSQQRQQNDDTVGPEHERFDPPMSRQQPLPQSVRSQQAKKTAASVKSEKGEAGSFPASTQRLTPLPLELDEAKTKSEDAHEGEESGEVEEEVEESATKVEEDEEEVEEEDEEKIDTTPPQPTHAITLDDARIVTELWASYGTGKCSGQDTHWNAPKYQAGIQLDQDLVHSMYQRFTTILSATCKSTLIRHDMLWPACRFAQSPLPLTRAEPDMTLLSRLPMLEAYRTQMYLGSVFNASLGHNSSAWPDSAVIRPPAHLKTQDCRFGAEIVQNSISIGHSNCQTAVNYYAYDMSCILSHSWRGTEDKNNLWVWHPGDSSYMRLNDDLGQEMPNFGKTRSISDSDSTVLLPLNHWRHAEHIRQFAKMEERSEVPLTYAATRESCTVMIVQCTTICTKF
eukprot:COSAG01_NODE_4122_length_5331_cov_11.476873_8_plen_446_part_00